MIWWRLPAQQQKNRLKCSCDCQRLCHFYFSIQLSQLWLDESANSVFSPTKKKNHSAGCIFDVNVDAIRQPNKSNVCPDPEPFSMLLSTTNPFGRKRRMTTVYIHNMNSICYVMLCYVLYFIMNCKWPTNFEWLACKLCHCRDAWARERERKKERYRDRESGKGAKS